MKRIAAGIKQAVVHPLAKGSAVVFAGTMAANVGAYLYHLVVGRILGPAGYGELAALLSLSYILNVFTVMLQTVVTKFVAEHTAKGKKGDIRALVLRLTGTLLIFGVIGSVLLVGLAPFIASFLNIDDAVVVFFLFAGVIFTLIGVVYTSVLQGSQRFATGMAMLNVNSLLRLAAGAAAAGFGVTATLAANAGAIAIASLIALIPIKDVIVSGSRSNTDFRLTPLFRTSIATFLAVLGISVLNSQDVILVKHFLPATSSGWYGALSTMGKIIFFASYSIGYVLLPVVTDRSARGTHSRGLVYMSLGVVAALSFMITAGYFLLPEIALRLLYGEAFVAAAPFLGQFAIFSSLYTVSYTIVMALLGLGATGVWVFLVGVAAAQDILLLLFHSDIATVIRVNTVVATVLTILLFVYYQRVGKRSQV